MTFDEIRVRLPQYGFALYAIEPGKPVTLEVIVGDNVIPFTAPTAAECLAQAFGENEPEPAPEPATAGLFD